MEEKIEKIEKTKIDDLTCPVCGAVREDPRAERCPGCAADLSGILHMEHFAQMLLLEAREDIRNRKYSDAQTKLNIISSLDKKNELSAKLISAEIDINNHDYQTALDTYEEIRGTGFRTSVWGINLGAEIDKLQEKIEIEQAAMEHFNLALHRSREGFFEEAREELYKAADLAPYLAEIYLLSAKVDLALGAKSALRDDLTRFRQLRPDDPRGINMEAQLERLKYENRIRKDQLFFAASMVIFAVSVLVIIVLIKL
jgi:tetratricopeptide (TPR) repeat protein